QGGARNDATARGGRGAAGGPRGRKPISIRGGDDLLGGGYESARQQTACIAEKPQTWKERVQVFRSDSLVKTQTRALERRLERAEAAVRALTPPGGPGRVQFTTGWELGRRARP